VDRKSSGGNRPDALPDETAILLKMFKVEIEQEADGRWIAEVPELPGVQAYGASREEAVTRAQALSLRVLAERLEHGEDVPQVDAVFSIVA
jgi:predicted RNase H-like HicB family nuclease